MTRLNNIKVPNHIHLNIEDTYKFIDDNLPEKYSRQVWNILSDKHKVDLAYIRDVKKNRRKNAAIMEALYRVAQWNKLQKEKK